MKTIIKYNHHIRLIYSNKLNKHLIKTNLQGLNLYFELSKNQERQIKKYNLVPKSINKDNLIFIERSKAEKNKKTTITTDQNNKIQISKYRKLLNSNLINSTTEKLLYSDLIDLLILKTDKALQFKK
jgi:hypothetical protein